MRKPGDRPLGAWVVPRIHHEYCLGTQFFSSKYEIIDKMAFENPWVQRSVGFRAFKKFIEFAEQCIGDLPIKKFLCKKNECLILPETLAEVSVLRPIA